MGLIGEALCSCSLLAPPDVSASPLRHTALIGLLRETNGTMTTKVVKDSSRPLLRAVAMLTLSGGRTVNTLRRPDVLSLSRISRNHTHRSRLPSHLGSTC